MSNRSVSGTTHPSQTQKRPRRKEEKKLLRGLLTIASPPSDVSRRLGTVARRVREEQQLLLADVAGMAGISVGMLSRLETGHVSPSLETLVALGRALGTKPAILLADFGGDDEVAQYVPAGRGLQIVRRGPRRRSHTLQLLATQRGPTKVFDPFLVTLTDKSEMYTGFQQPGTKFIYILEGSLTYKHGVHSYDLGPGDAVSLSANVPHGPESLREAPVRMLSIIIYNK
jgi:transcriptional regulator with XRE-family HTH domain